MNAAHLERSAKMMRAGLYRPVHVKTLRSQKLRMLLTHRKLLQSKAIAIDNDLRGTLRNFCLKVGVVEKRTLALVQADATMVGSYWARRIASPIRQSSYAQVFSMVSEIVLENPNNVPQQKLYEHELSRLKDPVALERRLSEMTERRPFRRLYVMGCGRSGTWVLTHVMNTFKDTDVVLQELTFEYFGLLATHRATLVLKRDHLAYQRVEKIPECIEIAYIVRHPFDVLTSHLPSSRRPYHILPQRWLGEITALRHLLDTGRKQTKIIRYEDLVTHPLETQSDLASFFGFATARSIDDLYTSSGNASEGPMHRARKLDPNSINKHQRDPEKVRYLKEIKPGLGEVLEWVGGLYHYDISL